MIGVPAALAAWAAELARLPTELALALAPWVGRLSLAIGPMAASPRGRRDEPDGFTGLARRGSYERLLATEWALAEMFPDEFARRAATGEHLFLELARRGHQATRWTVAVVSAGPEQLGAPRLAHLALMLVLARRASAAGAAFSWGVLEDQPRLALIDDLDAVGVRRLLDARTMVAGGAAAVHAWREALRGDRDLEIWWIGGPGDLETARAAGDPCALVHDVLEPGVHALDVEVARRGRTTPARVRLPLPPPDVCARLLREAVRPTGVGRAAALGGVARSIHFGVDGRRLLVQTGHDRVECWPIPNSPRDQIGRARRWSVPAQHHLIAMGSEQRVPIAAVCPHADPTTVELYRAGTDQPVRIALPPLPPVFGQLVRAGVQPGRVAWVPSRRGDHQAAVLAYAGLLFEYDGADGQMRILSGLDASVLATAFTRARVWWMERDDVGRVAVRAAGDPTPAVVMAPPRDVVGEPVHASFGFDEQHSGDWLAVVQWPGDTCTVAGSRQLPAHVACDARVVGVGRWQAGPAALLVQVDDHRLEWRLGTERRALPPSSDPIDWVHVCVNQGHLAWLTGAGEVSVHSARHAAAVIHLVPGGVEDAR